jgi:septum formation protein
MANSIFPLQRKIILASQSPRRKQLLQDAGFEHIVIRPLDVDESFSDQMPVDEVAPYLAHKKALAGKHLLQESDEVLLTADSVVILGDKIYNKPADYVEARYMLEQLSGQAHRVITGVCLCSLEKEKVMAVESKVFMADLTSEEIDYYVNKYQPYDKAGSYAIQEWIGLCKITHIEGTFTNIMGLPVHLVYQELLQF